MSRSSNPYDRKDKYIDFKRNGRLFPIWVLANFRDSKLPEIIRRPDEDPCKEKANAKKGFREYQLFISKYLDFNSPYRDILIYHGLGSGKTASGINVYNALYNYTPGWNVFILIKASLKDATWMANLKRWLTKDEYDFRMKNIIFVHYDSPFADRAFLDSVKKVDSSKKSLYIIDEVHNFISNVYSNISSQKGKRAQIIYDYMIQDKQENEGTRVVCLSGTPAINKPFELALLFNLLRPGIFPRSENEFNQLYVSTGLFKTISKVNKNMFQRRILGLVSYYIGSTPDRFARKVPHFIDVEMSDYQAELYTYFEELEEAFARKMRAKGLTDTGYKSFTRQACNFVFPNISQSITGENRPRPNKFRVSEREAETLNKGREDKLKAEKGKDKIMDVNRYVAAMEKYVKGFDDYLRQKSDSDKAKKHTIEDDIKLFKEKYKGDYPAFHIGPEKKSNLYKAMHGCSAKMLYIIFIIYMSPGPVLVYSNYVLMEGLEIFKVYLKYFGFLDYKKKPKPYHGYTEFHGSIKDKAERQRGLDAYNKTENKHGKDIKIIMISPAGAEGLDLFNVRQVHLMEPYWHEVRMTQMIGRAVRMCSHVDLPMEDRVVDVYRYKSIRKNKKWTTDQYIEDIARSKEGLIQSFLDAVKEAAIDCVLNKNHNMLLQENRCFQFNETSLFDKHIGPAYKEDVGEDVKIDNGSNSTKSMTVRIRVMKIQAVKLMNNDIENPEYSKPADYWLYHDSGTVYDFELKFPIGKVAMDENKIPQKLNKDTYIIDRVIPIPMIKS